MEELFKTLNPKHGFFVHDLVEKGIIIVKLFDDAETRALAKRFDEEIAANPLIRDEPAAKEAYIAKPAMSAFGALGDPYTRAMPVQRIVNGRTEAFVRHFLKPYAQRYGKNMFFINNDRAMVRVPGTKTNGESWHRDQPPEHTLPRNDIVLGGWCSIYGKNGFGCMPGTHFIDQNGGSGFRPVADEDVEANMDKYQRFDVPPGHALMFVQNMIHHIKPGEVKVRTARIFQGITFTNVAEPWFTDDEPPTKPPTGIKKDSRELALSRKSLHWTLDNFGVQRLPSGQTPYTYELMHRSRHAAKVAEYSLPFIGTIPRNEKGHVPIILAPLTEYVPPSKLPPAYTDEERAILFPHPF